MSKQIKACPLCGGEAMKFRDNVACLENTCTLSKIATPLAEWQNRPAEPQWQPIATAPKDGTPILAYFPQCSFEPSLKPLKAVLRWAKYGDWENYYQAVVSDGFAGAEDWQPTHWMPLPEPPK